MKYVTDYDINSMYAFQPRDVVGTFHDYIFAGVYMLGEWSVYQVLEPIGKWIEAQDEDKWLEVEEARRGFMRGYAISPELEMWMKLKW